MFTTELARPRGIHAFCNYILTNTIDAIHASLLFWHTCHVPFLRSQLIAAQLANCCVRGPQELED